MSQDQPANLAWDTPEWRIDRDVRLTSWMRGNTDAVRTVVAISHIAEIWDDLIDGDRKPSADELNHAFVNALIKLQTNPFYAAYQQHILPVIIVAVNAWFDANTLEQSKDETLRMLAFHIRNFGIEVAMICAFCVGGFDWMRKVSLEIREYMAHESYFDWEKRHTGDGNDQT